ncbi:MAG: TolC family outer membrane protein [Geminicoccaceae bacterium]|nr:TolC family outer membrane protein [Geminicoccaceae bacterium]
MAWRGFPLLVLALAGSWACAARAEVALTVALAKTYLENPRLEAARAGLRAVDEDVPAAKAGWRPRLSARTAIGMERTTTTIGDAVVQGQQAGLFLEQPVYDGGATQAAVDGAEAAVGAARERLLVEEQNVLFLGVRAFVGVLRQQRVLEVALANERRLGEQVQGARSRFRYGQTTGTDVAFAEARAAEAVARRRGAEADLRMAGNAFKRVIGDPPGTLIPPGLPPGLPASLAEAVDLARDHPLAAAAGLDLQVAQARKGAALARLEPRLALTGEAGYGQDAAGGGDWDQRLGVGASLAVPLYDGGLGYARIRQSRQLMIEGRHRLADARRAAEAEAASAWEAYQSAGDELLSLRGRAKAASLALDGVRQEVAAGARDLLQVLEAEQDLFEAEVDLALADEARVVAAYRLLAATGGLTAERLGLDVSLYDPDAYYSEVRGLWSGLGRGSRDDDEAGSD